MILSEGTSKSEEISEIDFVSKKKQVVWRGATKTNSLRKTLLKVTEKKEWSDVQAMEWTTFTALEDTSAAIPISEHCQYQFVIQTEGTSNNEKSNDAPPKNMGPGT